MQDFLTKSPELVEAQLSVVRMVLDNPLKLHEVHRLNGWHFSDLRLGRMFSAMLALSAAGKHIDTVTVVSQLRADGELENAGGPMAIASVRVRTHGTDIKECERIILSDWQRREGVRIAAEMSAAIVNPEMDPAATFGIVATDIDMVSNYVAASTEISTEEKVADFIEYIQRENSGVVFTLCDIEEVDNTADIQPGSLVVVSGSTGSGKSSFFNACAKASLIHKRPMYMQSGENGVRAQINRLLSAHSGIPAKDIKTNKLTPSDWVNLNVSTDALSASGIIIESGSITADQVMSKIRYLNATKEVTEFWFDRLELVDVSGFSRDVEQGRAMLMQRLRTMVVDLNIRVFMACQLRKSYESRARCQPEIVDLKGTSAIGDSATHVILLTRPEYHGILDMEDGSLSAGMGKIMVVKNTEGELGDFVCRFNKTCTTWESYDNDLHGAWKGSGAAKEPIKETSETYGMIPATEKPVDLDNIPF